MENLTREELIELIEKRPLILRDCSVCGTSLTYFYEDDTLFFDSNCNCVRYYSQPEGYVDEELDFYLERAGWQKYFKEFYKEELSQK